MELETSYQEEKISKKDELILLDKSAIVKTDTQLYKTLCKNEQAINNISENDDNKSELYLENNEELNILNIDTDNNINVEEELNEIEEREEAAQPEDQEAQYQKISQFIQA